MLFSKPVFNKSFHLIYPSEFDINMIKDTTDRKKSNSYLFLSEILTQMYNYEL